MLLRCAVRSQKQLALPGTAQGSPGCYISNLLNMLQYRPMKSGGWEAVTSHSLLAKPPGALGRALQAAHAVLRREAASVEAQRIARRKRVQAADAHQAAGREVEAAAREEEM